MCGTSGGAYIGAARKAKPFASRSRSKPRATHFQIF
jgi:hypothetical protein